MAANNDFLADPVSFMRKNIVIQTVGGKAVVGTTSTFSLVKHQGAYKGKTSKGKSCTIYELQQSVAGIPAYWCPYANDEVNSVSLAGTIGPGYMFTAKMDGCSFGVGMAATDGTVRVAHANTSNATDLDLLADQIGDEEDLDQRAALQLEKLKKKTVHQIDQLTEALDYGLTTMLTPMSYADQGFKSTTFGVRDGTGTWHFYYHVYGYLGINHTLVGCSELR